MEGFLNRYRNITVLLLVLFGQLVLLAYQVRNEQDVPMIRVWTVTAVTPVARVLEGARGGSLGFVRNYILLHNADAENRQLREENGRLKLENTFLKNELSRADRAKALQMFQAQTESKMLAATVIATGTGSSTSKVVYVDRGSSAGVMRGMAVVTPDGIVGKVIAAYPTASEVLLVTDPDFAAGVVSQKNQARGTLKGEGRPLCRVDYIPGDVRVEAGEWFYTSGDDRVFPRGFQVGVVKSVKPGQPFQEILVEPSGIQRGVDDVLILINGVHQEIPDAPAANQPVYIAPNPPPAAAPGGQQQTDAAPGAGGAPQGTDADRLRQVYKSVGDAQHYTFGDGGVGGRPADFKNLPGTPQPSSGGAPPGRGAQAPAGAPPAQGAQPPAAQNPAQPQGTQPPASPGPVAAPRTQTPGAENAAPAPRKQALGTEGSAPAPRKQASDAEGATPSVRKQASGAEGAAAVVRTQASGLETAAPAVRKQASGSESVSPALRKQASGAEGAAPAVRKQAAGAESVAPALSKQASRAGGAGTAAPKQPPAAGRAPEDVRKSNQAAGDRGGPSNR